MAHAIPISFVEPSLDNMVGALLLGFGTASILFGITTMQVHWYYHSYPNDSLLHKYSVGTLWILDTFHLALTVHAVYHYNVRGFGDFAGLANIVWSIKLQVSLDVLILFIVHSLYALRVWLLSGFHRGVLGYLVVSLVGSAFVIGVVLAYSIYTVDAYPELEKASWAIYAAVGTSTVIDFVLAAAMCHYLRKSKGSMTRMNSRISAIMQYTIGSGLFTSACSLSVIFLYALLPHTFDFLAVRFLLGQIYVVSFLVMLNARERKQVHDETHESVIVDIPWQQRLLKIRPTASSSSCSPRLHPMATDSPTTPSSHQRLHAPDVD